MPDMIFLNIPVRDLAAATEFYEAIGCTRNAQFSDDNSSSMAWSPAVTFQLMTHDYFATYAPLPIADAHKHCALLIALPRDSREAVDAVLAAAGSAGGRADATPPRDMGFMYVRSFADPDGHVFEMMWMDMSAMPAA